MSGEKLNLNGSVDMDISGWLYLVGVMGVDGFG